MTDRPLNVRFATANDVDEIARLMDAAFEEQPIFPLNKSKMRERVRSCTAVNLNDRKGMVGVVEGENGLEGYLIAVFSSYWYTDTLHLEELSNFVHPDHRAGKHHARDLIEFAKWFAEFCEVPLLLGIFSSKQLKAKVKLYERQAKLSGAVFVHNTGHVDNMLSAKDLFSENK